MLNLNLNKTGSIEDYTASLTKACNKYGEDAVAKQLKADAIKKQKTIFENDSKARVMGGDTIFIHSYQNMISSSISVHYYSKTYDFHKSVSLVNCKQNWDYLYRLDNTTNLNGGKFANVLTNMWVGDEEIIIPLSDWYEKYRK
tara:strand:+ start:541 stop:969 length:429 start_codon:yes stop_codon:yes gene_type:complete